MLTIYHNPRCAKSREALKYLQDKGIEHQVVRYLDQPFNRAKLASLFEKLGAKPVEMVRTQETLFKEQYKGIQLAPAQWIEALVEHPQLLKRPIVEGAAKAVLAIPQEKIDELL